MDERYEKLLDTCFGLRSGYFFAFPRPHEMQVRNRHLAGSLVSVSGREQDAWIATAFARINGRTTLREILSDVPEPAAESFLKIVLSLRMNFLQAVEIPASDRPSLDKDAILLQATSFAAEEYRTALEEANILVIGAGMLGSRVATGLAQSGVGNLTLFDDQLVQAEDQRNSPAYVFAQEGKPRAQELREFLVRMTGAESIAFVHGEKTDSNLLARLMESHTFAVLVEDGFDPRLHRLVNECAHLIGLPWAMASIDGWDLYVGPTFLPGRTGCYECFQQWHVSQMDKPDTYLRYEEHLQAGGMAAKLFVTPTAADLAAGLLASDLPNVIGRMPQRIDFEASLTLGRQLHLNLHHYDALFHPVAKVPRCKVCGQ